MRDKIMHTLFWLVGLKEKDHLEDLSAEGRTLLKRKLNVMGRCGLN